MAEPAGKQLELLKEMVPGASRIAVFINPDSQNAPWQLRNAQSAAALLGSDLRSVLEIRKPTQPTPS